MRKGTVIVILLALGILVFLFWLLFIHDEEKDSPPPSETTNTTTESNQKTQEDDEQEKQTKLFEQKLEKFVTEVLTIYSQYDPNKPTAHLDQLKPYITDQIYQEQKQLYSVPIPEITNRRLIAFNGLDYKVDERSGIIVEAYITIETTNSGHTFQTQQFYSLDLVPNGDSWIIRGLQYYDGHGSE
jgi:hypothetical protein